MSNKDCFLVNRLRSIKYAFNGAYLLLKTEASIKVQFCIGILMTIVGFLCHLSYTEWILQTLTIGLVLAIEGINTAVEEIADFIHPEQHPKIGLIKDISAGAVFIMALTAIIVGIIIYFPKFF
jgi:diacylglycerol kinase (ATP)